MRESGYTPIPEEEYPKIAQRRLNGETLQSIADDYDVTRERIRQIAKQVNPEIPIKLKRARRAEESKAAEERLAKRFIQACQKAIEEDRKCYSCGGWILRPGAGAVNCSEECSRAYVILRYVDDPQAHRQNIANSILNHPEKHPPTRIEWAESVLSGENTERNRTFLLKGSKRSEIIRKYRPELYEELTS